VEEKNEQEEQEHEQEEDEKEHEQEEDEREEEEPTAGVPLPLVCRVSGCEAHRPSRSDLYL
jgi:hypothetical protein